MEEGLPSSNNIMSRRQNHEASSKQHSKSWVHHRKRTKRDKKVKAGGIILDQTLVNGVSEGVSVRLINGTKKTAAVKLDRQALSDLLVAVQEVLAVEE